MISSTKDQVIAPERFEPGDENSAAPGAVSGAVLGAAPGNCSQYQVKYA